MKNITTGILILFTSFLFYIPSYAKSVCEDFDKVYKEINKTLTEIVLDEKLSGDINFKVVLTVNAENKIVVNQVSSHSNTLKRNVKAALNNKQLFKDDLIVGKEYVFEITIKTEG